MNRGEVYVGKKSERGVVGSTDPVLPNVLNINATSGSVNKINGIPAKQFSPMYLGPVHERTIFGIGDQTALTFEGYWQYGKIFRELGHLDEKGNITPTWYAFRVKGYNKAKRYNPDNYINQNPLRHHQRSRLTYLYNLLQYLIPLTTIGCNQGKIMLYYNGFNDTPEIEPIIHIPVPKYIL